MALRQQRWAARRRLWLIELLGSECAHCHKKVGALDPDGKPLRFEIDVIHPSGDYKHHRIMGSIGRICFYIRELKNHNIQLLCEPCNNSKHNRDLEEYYEQNPF